MESTGNQIDFIPQIKEFIKFAIVHLQKQKLIPQLYADNDLSYLTETGPQGKKQKRDEINWNFDCKDSSTLDTQTELNNKFGNFNTPIIMKLCSKYNKNLKSERVKVNQNEVA